MRPLDFITKFSPEFSFLPMFPVLSSAHNLIIHFYELPKQEPNRTVLILDIVPRESTSYVSIELVPVTFGSAHTASAVGSQGAGLDAWVNSEPVCCDFFVRPSRNLVTGNSCGRKRHSELDLVSRH